MMTARSDARAELARLCSAVLAGPLEQDETLGAAPGDTYLTAILWPKGSPIGAEEDDSLASGSDDDGEAEAAVPGYRAVRPCSMGLTFSAGLGAALKVDLGSTARYRRVEEPSQDSARDQADPDTPAEDNNDPAAPRKNWKWIREQLDYSVQIPFAPETRSWTISSWSKPDGTEVSDRCVTLHLRRRVDAERQVFTLTLINSSSEPAGGTHRDECSLFQTQMRVSASAPDGSTFCIRPRPLPPVPEGDEDAETSALLYRNVREFAVGHGIAAMWSTPRGEAVESVRTEWLPYASIKDTSAAGHELLRNFSEKQPDLLCAEWLARPDGRAEIIAALREFSAVYNTWRKDALEERLEDIPDHLLKTARANIGRCRESFERIGRGIRVLENDGAAWRAFTLANAAMDRQSRFAVKGERAGPLVWRPFQLAYLLMVLPGLVDPEEFRDDREIMDLLWFPTGGGKTEAYLGLSAFVIFFRRLSDATHASTGAVDVLMRYTLRLLTIQQFQRAASLVTACELLRSENDDLGSAPITIGLYVGSEATPNRMEDAITAVEAEHQGLKPKSTPRQLLKCPVCGTDLPPSAYTLRGDREAVDIRCPNTACETAGNALPVLTVDAQIYAAPPSLLIGTIDKFAQLPRQEKLRRLFGLDDRRRPELIIQDELHLISGPLGSMAGLYETAVDLLCTDGDVRPKIIGSTATIGQASRQVRALFDRSVRQFPPPGFDAADSFFAVRDESRPDRLYLGLTTAGRSPKFALQAVAAALLEGAGTLRDRDGLAPDVIDAFWTCVLYFNSLRELGGAFALMQDDVPRQMGFLATRLNAPERPMDQPPVELSGRVSSRELPEKLERLDATLSADDDPYAQPPEDAVLASNMISVGVDISRLGLMVVNGQPKSTAEYIQATSRVGRGIEGLVVTLYNASRPRDLSHFEHFVGYHSALYRSVEATSVTPWAPRARDKALHAMFASLVRHLADGMSTDEAALHFDPKDPAVGKVRDFILARAKSASHSIEQDETAGDLDALIRQWARRSQDGQSSGARLLYWEKKAPFGRTAPFLMYAAEEGDRNSMLAWATPNSMREVEPSTAFTLKRPGKR